MKRLAQELADYLLLERVLGFPVSALAPGQYVNFEGPGLVRVYTEAQKTHRGLALTFKALDPEEDPVLFSLELLPKQRLRVAKREDFLDLLTELQGVELMVTMGVYGRELVTPNSFYQTLVGWWAEVSCEGRVHGYEFYPSRALVEKNLNGYGTPEKIGSTWQVTNPRGWRLRVCFGAYQDHPLAGCQIRNVG